MYAICINSWENTLAILCFCPSPKPHGARKVSDCLFYNKQQNPYRRTLEFSIPHRPLVSGRDEHRRTQSHILHPHSSCFLHMLHRMHLEELYGDTHKTEQRAKCCTWWLRAQCICPLCWPHRSSPVASWPTLGQRCHCQVQWSHPLVWSHCHCFGHKSLREQDRRDPWNILAIFKICVTKRIWSPELHQKSTCLKNTVKLTKAIITPCRNSYKCFFWADSQRGVKKWALTHENACWYKYCKSLRYHQTSFFQPELKIHIGLDYKLPFCSH